MCNKRLVKPYIDYYSRYGFISNNLESTLLESYTLDEIIIIGNKQIEENKSNSQIPVNTNVETIINGYYNYKNGPIKLANCFGSKIRYFDQTNNRWVVFKNDKYTIEDFTWKVDITNNIFSITS